MPLESTQQESQGRSGILLAILPPYLYNEEEEPLVDDTSITGLEKIYWHRFTRVSYPAGPCLKRFDSPVSVCLGVGWTKPFRELLQIFRKGSRYFPRLLINHFEVLSSRLQVLFIFFIRITVNGFNLLSKPF